MPPPCTGPTYRCRGRRAGRVRRSACERAGASAPLARFRGHRRGMEGQQTPRKLNPTRGRSATDSQRTRTITNLERCPIVRPAPQRNRDSAPPAQDAAAGAAPARRSAGTPHGDHAKDRMIMIGSLQSSDWALVAVALAVGRHLPPFPPCA